MADESHNFTTTRARLEDIVVQVRKKDTSLEKSLDLLEEGVRLANTCTELIDHADWTAGGVETGDGASAEAGAPEDSASAVIADRPEDSASAEVADQPEEPLPAESSGQDTDDDPSDVER